MLSASLHQLLYRSMRKKNSLSRQIIQNETILNGHLSSQYMRQIRMVNQIINYLIVLHFLLLHCYFQADRREQSSYLYFLWGSQICGTFTMFCLILGHRILKQYMRLLQNKEEQVLGLVVNCLIAMVMPKLYFNNSFNNQQLYVSDFKLNYLLTVCSCARIISVGTAILINSKFSSTRATRACDMNGSVSGMLFTMRALFKQQPFTFIMTIFLISVAIFSYAFRIAECEFISQYPMTAYMNMIWLTTITMTTVGFGDYAPCTPIGRLVGVLCMSCGVLILSVMVAVLTQTLNLNSHQKQALVFFRKLQKKDDVKTAAGKYLRVALWRAWVNWKYNLKLKQDFKQRQKKKAFRSERTSYQLSRNLGCKVDAYHEMAGLFTRTEADMNFLVANNRRLLNFICEQMMLTGDMQTNHKRRA